MAKKKPDTDETDVNATETVEAYSQDDLSLEQALAQLPQNSQCVQIFRIKELGGRPLYLEAVQPGVFSLEYIASKFGGGRYIAHGKYSNGEIVKYPFEIDGDPIPVIRRGKGMGADPAPELLQALRQSASPEKEYVEVADGENSLTQVLIAMIKQNSGSRAQFYEELKAMREVLGPQTVPAPQPLEQIASWFQKGLEFSGGGKDTPVWLEVLKEFKQPLEKAVDTVQMAVAARQAAPAPAPNGVRVAPPPGQAETVPLTEENMQLFLIHELQRQMPTLNRACEKGAHPDTYVELLVDQLDETYYPTLLAFLERPDCLELIGSRNEHVRKHPAWWMALRKGLIETLKELGDDAGTSVQPTENSGSATVDSAAR